MEAHFHWRVEIQEQERKLEQMQEQQRQVERQKQERERQLWRVQEELRQLIQKKEELKRRLQEFEDRLKLQEKEREAQQLEDQRQHMLKEVRKKEQMLKDMKKMEQTCQSLKEQEQNTQWDLKKLGIKGRSLKFQEQVFCETLRTLQDFESKEKKKLTGWEEHKFYLKLEEGRLEERRREETLEWSHAYEKHKSNVKEFQQKSFQPGHSLHFYEQAIANVGTASTLVTGLPMGEDSDDDEESVIEQEENKAKEMNQRNKEEEKRKRGAARKKLLEKAAEGDAIFKRICEGIEAHEAGKCIINILI